MSKKNGAQINYVDQFMSVQEELFKYFGCNENFFLKPMLSIEWKVVSEDDFHFLNYWVSEDKRMNAVIVKKDGEPMIFKTEKYTMVIGIDCVKIGFIFENNCKR